MGQVELGQSLIMGGWGLMELINNIWATGRMKL